MSLDQTITQARPATARSALADLNLLFLQAELARIDILIQRQVRRWRLAGQDPSDTFRGLYVSDGEVNGLLARPLGSNWGQMIDLPPDERQAFETALAESAARSQQLSEAAHSQGQPLRLRQLQAAFELTPFALDTLLICLAPSFDLRYERIFGYLQDDVTRKRPTINLILDLLAPPDLSRISNLIHFDDEAPLFKYQLLQRGAESDSGTPLLSHTLHVNKSVLGWLLGQYQPHDELASHATLRPPASTSDEFDVLLTDNIRSHLSHLLHSDQPPLLVFHGLDTVCQRAAAGYLAGQQNRSLLEVDLTRLAGSEAAPLSVLRPALRDARLTGAIPCLLGWDTCLHKDGSLSADLLAELCRHPDLIIVASQTKWQAEGIDRDRPIFSLTFPVPAYTQRLALWQHFLRNPNSNIDLPALAGQFALTSGQIRDTVASARDLAAQQGEPVQNEQLFLAARAHSNPRLAALARKIVPRYTWDDIILPRDQLAMLNEIVATVRGRPQVLEDWGVGKKLASSAAVTVLFAGDPGTGKTMAAEVIADELRLDLYKIDLSTVVSKYIGETEKNLERIFNEAESSNAILFFDEADAIFGKRSEVKDAHDRYANIEVSYLLQRMEAYDGVTILATNLRANLDEAFTRRLQFAVDFPFPEPDNRLRIWQTLFPPDVPREAELNFDFLARRFKLAGGNIRNIIVSAAYLAAADGQIVTMAHLLHGTRRELQKMGRLVGEDDFKV